MIDTGTIDDKLILAGDDLMDELLDGLRIVTDSRDCRNDLMHIVSVEDDLCLDIQTAETTDEQLVVQSLGKRILLGHAKVLFLRTGIGVEHALVAPGVSVHAHGNLRTLLLDMLCDDKVLRGYGVLPTPFVLVGLRIADTPYSILDKGGDLLIGEVSLARHLTGKRHLRTLDEHLYGISRSRILLKIAVQKVL